MYVVGILPVAGGGHARDVVVLCHDTQLVIELLHAVAVRARRHLLDLLLLLQQLLFPVPPLRVPAKPAAGEPAAPAAPPTIESLIDRQERDTRRRPKR